MDKLTALSAAGALAMTSVAAVSALFLTIGQGATASSPDPAPAMPVVVTEYQVIPVDANDPIVVTPATTAANTPSRTVYEIDYVQAEPAPTYTDYDDDHDEDHDEYEEEDDD
jgi:hypothetical protein